MRNVGGWRRNSRLWRLWPLPLLAAGCSTAYYWWPSGLAVAFAFVSVMVLLPLLIVSLLDLLREFTSWELRIFPDKGRGPARPLFGGSIANALDAIAGGGDLLVGMALLATVVAGLGGCGYLLFVWVAHFVRQGEFLVAGGAGFLGLLAFGAAIARVPLALFLLFGCAAVCGVAFLMGYSNLLQP